MCRCAVGFKFHRYCISRNSKTDKGTGEDTGRSTAAQIFAGLSGPNAILSITNSVFLHNLSLHRSIEAPPYKPLVIDIQCEVDENQVKAKLIKSSGVLKVSAPLVNSQ